MDREFNLSANTSSAENALARIDSQLASMQRRTERLFGTRGQGGVFNQALPELSGFSRVLEQQVGRSLDRLINGGARFSDVMLSVKDNLLQVVTQLGIINPLVNGLFGAGRTTIADVPAGDGLLSGIFSSIGGLFGGGAAGSARALGGPVNPGRAYLIGEQGPEMFVPQGAGNVVPLRNGVTGGGATINVSISTPDPQRFRESSGQISALLLDAVRRGQRLR